MIENDQAEIAGGSGGSGISEGWEYEAECRRDEGVSIVRHVLGILKNETTPHCDNLFTCFTSQLFRLAVKSCNVIVTLPINDPRIRNLNLFG